MNTHSQSGQAIVEGVVVLGVLASLWLGVAWMGRLQDAALHAGHASRHQAFVWAHQEQDAFEMALLPGQAWQTRRGEAFLDVRAARDSVAQDGQKPPMLPGDPEPAAEAMRRELRMGDSGVWVMAAHRQTTGDERPGVGLQDFDRIRLDINRHTAIMRGSGAALSDEGVQMRLAQADSIWARQADRSATLGAHVSGRVSAADAAWGRADFSPDWLARWTGWVPAHHLQTRSAP